MIKLPSKPRVLVFSQRNVFKTTLFRCSLYEFENVVSEIDSVEMVAPAANISGSRYRFAKQLAYHSPMALCPATSRTHLKEDYDLFLAVCGFPIDLLMLKAVSNWRERCKTAVCLIDEVWATQLSKYDNYLRLLEQFDAVMLYYSNTVKPLSERIGTKCHFLPPGVDAIRFCPYPEQPHRSIDVCSIGRRSETSHSKLLSMVEKEGIFYLYDTIAGSDAINSAEHRALTANIAKRSRYFIVNPGLIDRPDIRGNQLEVGNRYFEGSAAGAILLGERAENEVFRQLFDWPDALVHLPYDSGEVDEIIHELDTQPERQETIRRTNVAQTLLRHDWVYRWQSILETVNLEPMPELWQRKERLKRMAERVTGSVSVAAV
jgi:Glycosyl transferases group 1